MPPPFMIEPVFLSRKPLPPDKHVYEFEALANHTFVGLIRQMSSLLQAAGKVYDSLAEECLRNNLRTQSLIERIKTCSEKAQRLKAKTTKIPFERTKKEAIQKYSRVNGFHEDGSSSCGDQTETSCKASSVGHSEMGSFYGFPSSEEQMSVSSQDSHHNVIVVDVSEKPFRRMSSFRRSLIHKDFVIKRVKLQRSRSVSKDSRSRSMRRSMSESNNFSKTRENKKLTLGSTPAVSKMDEAIQTDPIESVTTDIISRLSHSLSDNSCCSNNRTRKLHFIQTSQDEDEEEAEGSDILLRGSSSPKMHSTGTQMSSMRLQSVLHDRLNSVKMRGGNRVGSNKTGGRVDDGRSSSGNWSASSSNHESDTGVGRGSAGIFSSNNHHYHHQRNMQVYQFSRSSSGHSMEDKDSVLSDSIIAHADTDTQGSVNGYASDTSGLSQMLSPSGSLQNVIKRKSTLTRGDSIQYANRDSESWLQYYDQTDSSDTTVTPTGDEATSAASDTETLHDSDSGSRQRISHPSLPSSLDGDEGSSVHSMDTDGYYTSMHTDSGLLRGKVVPLLMTPNSSFRLKEEKDGKSATGEGKGKRNSVTSVTTVGDVSLNSVLSHSESDHSYSSLRRIKTIVKPPPPPRVFEVRKENSPGSTSSLPSTTSHSPSPGLNYISESETSECQNKRRQKTAIDSSKYPSMCVVTTSEGSDGSSEEGENGSTRRRQKSTPEKVKSRMKIRDIFSIKPLNALSKTISKSRESIEEKLKSAFGSFTSSSLSSPNQTSRDNSSKIPPQTKAKPKIHAVSPLQLHASHFLKRNTDRIHPDVKMSESAEPGPQVIDFPSASSYDDPFSRLFPLNQAAVTFNGTNTNNTLHVNNVNVMMSHHNYHHQLRRPPLRVDYAAMPRVPPIKRPDSLPLSSDTCLDDDGRLIKGENVSEIERGPLDTLNHHHEKGRLSGQINSTNEQDTAPQADDNDGEDNEAHKFLQDILSFDTQHVKEQHPKKRSSSLPPGPLITRSSSPSFNEERDFNSSFLPPSSSPRSKHHEILNRLSPNSTFCSPGVISPKNSPSSVSMSSSSSGSLSPHLNRNKKSLLTTDDLLNLIHESKKKLNLKDTDLSPPSIQKGLLPRSMTPNSFLQSYNSSSIQHANSRRSWAGTSTASEYLNISPRRSHSPLTVRNGMGGMGGKPTTMTDFIKLLSQTKVTSPTGQRKSAAEMLKLSPSKLSPTSSDEGSSQIPPLFIPSSLGQKSRLNGRIYTRASYCLNKMYPPIDETDELSKSREQIPTKSFSICQEGDTGDEKEFSKAQIPLHANIHEKSGSLESSKDIQVNQERSGTSTWV